MAQLEIKKMKQGMSYSCKEKTIILNVFKYFRIHFPEKCVTDIVRRTAKATGCSEKSIFQFRKEEASVEGFKEPSKTKIRKNININSRDIKYDDSVRQSIRTIIYDLKYRNVVPSLSTILKQVNADNQIPNFSLMTLRRLIFDMGFCYEKSGNKSILIERPDPRLDSKVGVKVKAKPVNPPNQIENGCNIEKPQMPQNVQQTSHMHHNMGDPQGHRVMPMLMPPHEAHMMPQMHVPASHGMPMMLNHRRDLMPPPHHAMGPPNMDMHVKREMAPWGHSYNMIKQQ